MWYVYVLLSEKSGKAYVGVTGDLQRRLFEHNVSEKQGFTLRYRPWKVVYTESFDSRSEAMKRERFLKSGQGREQVKLIIHKVRYPPEVEKD